jgi:sulfur carrier protein
MELLVNGKVYASECLTLEQLLREMQLHERNGVAVAVNEQVVPRNQWKEQLLQAADRVMVIQATAGG